VALALYMDHHVPRQITAGLRLRGIDVLTAYEDGTHDWDDVDLLSRATELNRVLFTRDDDLLAIARQRQLDGTLFLGVIFAHQLRVSIGACVDDLEIIAVAGEPADLVNGVQFLPL
jgi:predicted nuclease of predicted toxin-antitoxin system